jgi:hypothetical protein
MTFYFALLLLASGHLVSSIDALVMRRSHGLAWCYGHAIVCTFALSAFWWQVLGVHDWRGQRSADVATWLVAVFGFLTSCMYGWKAVQVAKAGIKGDRLRELLYGFRLWAVMGGLYLVGAVGDHWLYYLQGNPAETGLVNASAIGAPDVSCDQFILVTITKKTAKYRCPVLLLGGELIDRPFVPWPGYREGESKTLKSRIEELLTDQKKAGTTRPEMLPEIESRK